MSDIEKLVLTNLIFNEQFGRKVAPFLKTEYFTELPNQVVYELTNEYINKYNSFPTKEVLGIGLDQASGLSQETYRQARALIGNLHLTHNDIDYLSDVAEEWCQNRALHLALLKSISITEGEDKNYSKGAIPGILSDALAVSFDTQIGHDFLIEDRYEFYHRKEKRVPFHLEMFNRITNGGLPNKTLSLLLAGVGIGKSMFMCDMAAHHLLAGYNVLYITLEMAEERIAERIDANLLNIDINELRTVSEETYRSRLDKLKGKVNGSRLYIKEYPTSCAGVGHFRHLLHELKLKKKFIPDIIYVDYVNLCTSSRFKHGANVNSYFYIKSISEELRGLAVEMKVPIVSATQLTRSGFSSSDVDLEDTAESFGLPATVDFMFALIATEELNELNQILVKQLKSRLGDKEMNKRFVIGMDRGKMRFYDTEQVSQEDILEGPVTTEKKKSKYKDKFVGFK